LNNKMAGLPRR